MISFHDIYKSMVQNTYQLPVETISPWYLYSILLDRVSKNYEARGIVLSISDRTQCI